MVRRIDYGGCPLAYKVRGQGQPVVFIQGVGIHGDGWIPQTDALSCDFQCLTFDNRGMGRSQPPGGPITVEQMAWDTIAVMEAAGIKSAHLVGHSLGGVIAQQIALTERFRVRSLSLLCTSGRGADATRFSPALIGLGMLSRIGLRPTRRLAFLKIVMPSEYLKTQNTGQLAHRLAPIIGHDLADSPSVSLSQLMALRRFNATAQLRKLAGIPVLVLSARHDIIFPPRCGRALAEAIPGSRYIEIANAAHGVSIQCADQVNDALRQQFELASIRNS